MSTIQLEASWLKHLNGEFGQEYMHQLKAFLEAERKKGVKIYPPGSLIFNALNTTPFDNVKIVLIGQDPYHGAGQARSEEHTTELQSLMRISNAVFFLKQKK